MSNQTTEQSSRDAFEKFALDYFDNIEGDILQHTTREEKNAGLDYENREVQASWTIWKEAYYRGHKRILLEHLSSLADTKIDALRAENARLRESADALAEAIHGAKWSHGCWCDANHPVSNGKRGHDRYCENFDKALATYSAAKVA